MTAPTTALDDMRTDWAEQDARLAAAIDGLTARATDVLDTPGLSSPVVELTNIVRDLLNLVRNQVDDDYEAAP